MFKQLITDSLWLHSNRHCPEAGVISVCFLFFEIPLPRGGSYPSIAIPTGAKHRVQSPLERWPHRSSTDRPAMEARPYEFLFTVTQGPFWWRTHYS